MRLTVEGLEGRELLTATPLDGGQWAFGSRITYSFAPDGTSVGGVSNNLNATLNAGYGSSAWQQEIEKAFALWSSYANINIAQVTDDGSAFGASGNQQDDSRFGDIRIAMIPQGTTGTLAYAMLPPPINGGTNAGDIVLNSNYTFGASGYDLETVAIHEIGHALGLDHSPTASDVMYAYYNGTNQAVSSNDTSAVTSLYGAFPADAISNGTSKTATAVTLNASGQATLSGLSMAGTSDVDWYVATAPSNTSGTLTVKMQSDGLSSLAPRFVIYAANGSTTLAQGTAPNVYGTTVTASVSVQAGQKFYIKAMPASSLGSYGSYGLLVNFGTGTMAAVAPPNTVVAQKPDQGGSFLSLKDSNGQTLLDRVNNDLNQGLAQLQANGVVTATLKQQSVTDYKALQAGLQSSSPLAVSLNSEANALVNAFNTGTTAAQIAAIQAFQVNVFHAGTMTTLGDALRVSDLTPPKDGHGWGHGVGDPPSAPGPATPSAPIVIVPPIDPPAGVPSWSGKSSYRPISRPFPFA